MKLWRSRGVREEGTDHTKLFSRIFTGSGLTWHQKVNFSTFDGKLHHRMVSKPSSWTPSSRTKASIFDIYISHYPSQKQKNENQDLGFPNKNQLCFLKMTKTKHIFTKNTRVWVSPFKSIILKMTKAKTKSPGNICKKCMTMAETLF